MNPVLVSLGPLSFRWYGLFFALSFLIGYWIMRWMYRGENRSENELDRLLMVMVAGVIVGARLGHCLFYDPVWYLKHPMEILRIWEGGLASHGAAVGILASLYGFSRKTGRPSWIWLLDHIVIPVSLAGCFIRLGNFFNSELVGIPTDVSWAVVFEQVDGIPRHAVQLYEAGAYGMIFVLLILLYRRTGAQTRQGMFFSLFLITVFTSRFLLEFFKTPQAAYEAGFTLTVGQWLSIPFVFLGLIVFSRK